VRVTDEKTNPISANIMKKAVVYDKIQNKIRENYNV